MSEPTFAQMQGVTFADFSEFVRPAAAIEESFAVDPVLRADCPHCHMRWEGTFEQITQHVEQCREAG